MNCPDFNTLMMFLDGELGEERMKEVSEHVGQCSRCRNLIDSQRNLETSWRDSFVTPEDDKFRSMEWIIYRKMNRRSRWKFFVPAAAGIVAVLLGVKLIMDNQPFKGRVTELLRDGRTDYVSYTLRFDEERGELPVSGIDEFGSEETPVDASFNVPTEESVQAEDISAPTTGEAVGYSTANAEPVDRQFAVLADTVEEYLRGSGSAAAETYPHTVAGGELSAGGSGGIGAAASSGYINEEECEEAEIPEEIMFSGAFECSGPEGQTDDIGDITLSLDSDTAELAVIETVPSSTGIFNDTENNMAVSQSCDYYSRLHETSDHDMNTTRADIYVELVFDEGGQPDSSTALLLDTLFAGWSDYIPIEYRDTVIIVPMSGVSELFLEGCIVPAETIE
ncbi:MAG: zf-HC2 domain-containing protein [Candidatus Aegiribacteria sp.]|nr:zf-HC2 domain-containing protein [Candidatus Aegiribacteria sp.]